MEIKDLKEKLGILERAIEDGLSRKRGLPALKIGGEGEIRMLGLKIEELQRKRGILLASGENVEEVSAEIQSVTHSRGLAADKIIGFGEASEDLDRELTGLKEEKNVTVREIYALHACPIIRSCNRIGEELAVEYRKLWKLLRAMGVPQDIEKPAGNNAAVCSSFWGGSLTVIPRLYSPGDYGRECRDIFKYAAKDYDAAEAKGRFLK